MNIVINKKKIFFYIAFAVICIFLTCLSTQHDFDLFARLIVGERFIEQGIFPYQDFLSYTPTHAWYDHEWESGVIFYLILKYLGPIGLILFQSFMMFLISVFVIKTQQLQKHPFPPSLIFITLFAFLFWYNNSFLIRCQLFSFLFFSIYLYILEGTRVGKFDKLIWVLPFITIFWNNVHGGVVSGLGLIAMYSIGAILERKSCLKYILPLLVSCLCLFITPYGKEYVLFLLSATTKTRDQITEWLPFSRNSYYLEESIFIIFIYIFTIFRTIKLKQYDITKLIVISVTLYLGLLHVKLLTLTIVAISSLYYNDIFVLFKKFKKYLKQIEKSLYLTAFSLALTIPLFSPNLPRVQTSEFPFTEIEFLRINNIKGNLVTDFGLGSYASYKLYPNIKIYMDGRYEEVYNDKEFEILRKWELAKDDWKIIIDEYPTDIMMPPRNTNMYYKLLSEPDWINIFEGDNYAIFIKRENQQFSYLMPETDRNYYRKTMFNHGEFKND